MPFSVSSTIPEIAARLGRGIPPQLLEAGVVLAAERLNDPMTAAIQREEPVDTGALREQTSSAVIPLSDGAMLETRSDARNQSGQHYAYFVYTRHRIVAWGHDTGRLSVPDLFPQRALAAMAPRIAAETAAAADETAATVLRILA